MKLLIRISLIVFLIIFAHLSNISVAQEIYDLNRCIQKGLERNFALQVVRNNEEIAKNNKTFGNVGMLPLITTTNQVGGTVNTIHQNLRAGGENISDNANTNFGTIKVDLGMNIFKGFQVKYNYEKLGILSEIGSLNTQMAIENLVSQIVASYHYYVEQIILYKNMAYAVSLSRERVRIDEQRYLLGSASKLELLQSLVYLNADSSRYARQKEVLKTAQIKLNELMASDELGEEIILKDTAILINEGLLFDSLLAFTLEFNTSLQIASKNKDISKLDYKIIQSRSYPYLKMTSGYSYNYNLYETGDYSNQQLYGLNYGLTFGMDIFDGFNKKREKNNARIEFENHNIQYQELEQEVKAELLTIYYAYENNLRLLRLEGQNLEVARENLEIALERYKLGSLSGLELREVQKSLLDAEERLVSIKYQAKLAEISLLHISGRITDYI